MTLNSYKDNLKLAENFTQDLPVEINGEECLIRITKVVIDYDSIGPTVVATIFPASTLQCSTIED